MFNAGSDLQGLACTRPAHTSPGVCPERGWLQHELVQTDGNVILSVARCWSKRRPSSSKRKTEKALWSKPLGVWPSNRWQACLLKCPVMPSERSTTRHSSLAMNSSCVPAPAWVDSTLGACMHVLEMVQVEAYHSMSSCALPKSRMQAKVEDAGVLVCTPPVGKRTVISVLWQRAACPL